MQEESRRATASSVVHRLDLGLRRVVSSVMGQVRDATHRAALGPLVAQRRALELSAGQHDLDLELDSDVEEVGTEKEGEGERFSVDAWVEGRCQEFERQCLSLWQSLTVSVKEKGAP